MFSNRAEEIIAHFIGHFDVRVEEMRQRLDYAEFAFRHRADEPAGDLVNIRLHNFQFVAVAHHEPGVDHAPRFWHPQGHAPLEMRWPEPIDVPVWRVPHDFWFDGGVRVSHGPVSHDAGHFYPGPGQVILVAQQQILLHDNDVVVLGDGIAPELDPTLAARLDQLVISALSVGAELTQLDMPHNVAAIPDFFDDAAGAIQTLANDGAHVVASGASIQGIYVNGVAVDEAPGLDDLLPAVFDEKVIDDVPVVSHATKEITAAPEGSLTVQAGANLLSNSAILTNTGLMGGVVAVAGNVHSIDAVIQVNAISDNDSGLTDLVDPTRTQSAAYNVANFLASTPDADVRGIDPDSDVMPASWQLSVIDGNAIFMQWITQVTFAYDHDIHVLSQTGANTVLTTGANFAQNIVSFEDLGSYYDLILVGGNLYDANVILQTNVLLDDDTGMGGGAGGGSHGNLLYNSATIANIGAQNWIEGLPAHYLEAMANFGHGNYQMPAGFGDDAGFAGIEGLSVLIITGDVYDLHYIKQVNVLGDADHVATAEAALLDPSTSDWDISTGSNALLNIAAIVDVDTMGDVAYVGGDVYSDAILIQAEILGDYTDLSSNNPEALANEAVAFLGDNDTHDTCDDDQTVTPHADSPTLDVMQSVLA
ncbi:hypothetical protein VW29_16370 [Devosia limi DSM 17137]|nr:hypothetical protein VW29_16370 [Devosia limi DSM 17137]